MGRGSDRQKKRAQAAKKAEKRRTERKEAAGFGRFRPKFGELPDPRIMEAISDSVHEAITNVFNQLEKAGANTGTFTQNAKIKGRCLYYASAGQFIASMILGRDYCVQVGSLGVATSKDMMFTIDAKNGGVAARRFHMWLAADDGGLIEFVDFTSRFFKDWALESGMTWERAEVPAYLWGKQKDIRDIHDVHYEYVIEEETDADNLVTANKAIIDRIVEEATVLASNRLRNS